MCILMLQVDDIGFYILLSTNIVILYSFLCALNNSKKEIFLQSFVASNHQMNKVWFSSMSLESLEILSSKV